MRSGNDSLVSFPPFCMHESGGKLIDLNGNLHEVQLLLHDSADALVEPYQLLNEYAPPWYEEQHQRKAETVLRRLGRL